MFALRVARPNNRRAARRSEFLATMMKFPAFTRFVLLPTALLAGCAAAQTAAPHNAALPTEQSAARTDVYPLAMVSNGQFFGSKTYAPAILDAGATMVRLDAAFATVRPAPGDDPDKWNWKTLDAMRAIKEEHPRLQYLGLLGYGTAWAQDPKYGEGGGLNSPQKGVDVRPVEAPGNLYGHYVYQTVRRYKDTITHWESWNEPDLPGAHFFKGNGADFLAYQRTMYLAAKKADPNCTVLFPGLTFANVEGYLAAHGLQAPTIAPPASSFFEEYLRAAARDPDAKKHGYYFDVMNQHSYSRASDLYDYSAVVRKLMRDTMGEEKPLWITEYGATDDGGVFGLSPETYADYVLQSYAWGKLGGVEKFFFFQLDNSNNHGLFASVPDQPKPALIAYRDVLAKEFAPAKFVGQLHGSRGVDFLAGNSAYRPTWKKGYNLFEFKDGDKRLLMAWADTAKTVTVKVPAQAPSAILVNRFNQRREVRAKNGFYEIELPGATNLAGWPSARDNPKAVALGEPEHLVGGATQVLIEG